MAKEKWTNRDIEQDPAGYLQWQQEERDRKAAAEQKRRGEDDLNRYTEEFVRTGGNRGDAPAAFKAHRNQQAAAAAMRVDEAASEQAMRRIAGSL